MQAIRTQYKGPTNTHGSRIIATSAAGRTVMAYDHELDLEVNHARAAEIHAATRWGHKNDPARVYQFAHGTLSDGSHVHVVAGWF